MATMKFGRIGVWFILALTILVLSALLGGKVGEKVALYRYRSAQNRSLGNLSAPEHAHLELVLDELQAIGIFRADILISPNNEKLRPTFPDQLARFEAFGEKVKTAEAKPVRDLNLALSDVVTAIVEEQSNNKDRAANYMRSAQSLYQTLGWRDYSENTLRAMAQRELDKWKLDSPSKVHSK
jgi:hypothetical protein